MMKKTRAVFLTALVIYAGANTTVINKTAAQNIALTQRPLFDQITPVKKEPEKPKIPEEEMFLFEHQLNPYEHYLQETPKIKKKKR